MNGLINLELFRCFYLECSQRFPWVYSDAARRKSVRSENSETVSRKSVELYEERTIRKFRIVAPEAVLGLRNYSPCWIQP